MALIKCHECGSDVSSEAAACPKCGVKPKQPKKEPQHLSKWQVLWGLGVALACVAWMANRTDNSSPSPSASQASEETCRQDLQCWGKKSIGFAENRCKEPIEKQALHSIRWDDDWSHPMFARLAWHDQAAGVITFMGDRVEFQNGFGAFTRFTYACDYDTALKTVVEVRTFEGRLD